MAWGCSNQEFACRNQSTKGGLPAAEVGLAQVGLREGERPLSFLVEIAPIPTRAPHGRITARALLLLSLRRRLLRPPRVGIWGGAENLGRGGVGVGAGVGATGF